MGAYELKEEPMSNCEVILRKGSNCLIFATVILIFFATFAFMEIRIKSFGGIRFHLILDKDQKMSLLVRSASKLSCQRLSKGPHQDRRMHVGKRTGCVWMEPVKKNQRLS